MAPYVFPNNLETLPMAIVSVHMDSQTTGTPEILGGVLRSPETLNAGKNLKMSVNKKEWNLAKY